MSSTVSEGARRSAYIDRAALDHALVEAVQDYAICGLDADGVILTWNAGAEQLTGYAPSEVVGRDVSMFYLADDVAAGRPHVELLAARRDGRAEDEGWRVRKDGSRMWAHVITTPLRDESGQVWAYARVVRDLTKQRRAEAALATSEATFRSLSASSPMGIFQSDATGGITYANSRALQIFGLTEAAALGSGWLQRIHPDDLESLVAGWSAALAAEKEYAHEYRLLLDDGSIRWVHGRAAPLLGTVPGRACTVGTILDITEHRALEAELRQAQKMEAIGRLAGGVAHDFNNLLMVISGNIGFMRDELVAGSQVMADLEQIEMASVRAAALTRQLLAFSRKQVLQPRCVDVNETVHRLNEMLRRLIGEHVTVEMDAQPDAWPVQADPGQLEQVLVNLVVNARDAMPGGGTIRIATRNLHVDEALANAHGCECRGDFLSITVSDTGVGIPAHVMPHIFEPFYTSKALGAGTGLGLATVYGIVKQSGGHVRAEDVAGQGSRFTVLLPRDTTVPTTTPAVQAPRLGKGRGTILVVEDEAAVRSVVARMLTSLGFVVIEAANGAEALDCWRMVQQGQTGAPAERIDLVLADIVMPVLGGRELVEALRAEQADVRVVLMTGYTSDAAGTQAQLSTAGTGFLRKPITIAALAEQVRLALQERGGDAE